MRGHCVGCPNAGKTRVPYNGDTKADIFIVGESPGYDEERTGRGFVGRAGKLLDKNLHKAGIVRGNCFISNAAMCLINKKALGQKDIKKTTKYLTSRPFLSSIIFSDA